MLTTGTTSRPEKNYSAPGRWDADNIVHYAGDRPDQTLDDNTIAATCSIEAWTYVMYLPPGLDVQWVPLHLYNWAWYAHIVRPDDGGWAAWLPTQPNNQTDPPYMKQNARWYLHPTWTQILN